jgi:hypothetical protein
MRRVGRRFHRKKERLSLEIREDKRKEKKRSWVRERAKSLQKIPSGGMNQH